MCKEKSFRSLEQASGTMIHWFCIIIFFLLTLSALLFTRYFPKDYQEEIPYNCLDLLSLAGAVMIGASLLLFGRRLMREEGRKERNLRILFGVVLSWIVLFGIVWGLISKSIPVSDQLMVLSSAERFSEGNFGRFEYGKYLYYYPSQLGLAAYEELIFRIVGKGAAGIRALQLLNVAGMAVGLIAGCGIVRQLFGKPQVQAYFLLLYGTCFPFLLYSVFIYGDVLGTVLSLTAVWQLLRYHKEGKKSGFWLMLLSISIAVVIRNNSLIAVIACICVLGVLAVSRKTGKYFLGILLLIAVLFGSSRGLKALYEARSGLKIHDGVPAILWIAMGMQEGDKEAGWYNGYSMYTYQDICGYDGEAASKLGKEEICSRAKEFLKNPVYAADFYGRKLTSQWNEPTYGCFIMTLAAEEERGELTQALFFGGLHQFLLAFMDSYQLFIYAMVLLLLLRSRKKEEPLENHILLIIIIGGVLFHLLWEAKSRYVLPYFVMMLPLAAGGLYQIQGWRTKYEADKADR